MSDAPEPTHAQTDLSAAESVPATVSGSTESIGPVVGNYSDDEPRFRPSPHRGDLGRLGRYRIVKRLGRGGMGVVYLGYDEKLRRKVAIKVLPPKLVSHPGAVQRFQREARTASEVRSEHVVAIHDVDDDNGLPFIVMEYLQGSPLDRYLASHPPLTVPQIIRIGQETARGLAAAHEKGLVHRDIKPANIWLEAPNGRVKILDFGLAKETEPADDGHLTRTGQVVGTPAFMSPEQARGEPVTAATDLFSLGIVLYRLATGVQPFRGPTAMAVLMALGLDEPTPVRELNPAVPEPLAALLHQLLAKKPGDRPASAAAVQAALAAIDKRRSPPAQKVPAAPAAPQTPNPEPTPYPSPAPITVGVQPESVWDRLGVDDTATAEAEPAHHAADRPRKSSGAFPWLLACGLLLAVGVSVTVLVAVLYKWKTKSEPDVVNNNVPAPPPPPKPFFNKSNLEGWMPQGPKDASWRVENGELIGAFAAEAKPGTSFVCTRQVCKNFELSFLACLPRGGTAALFFRAEMSKTAAFTLVGPSVAIEAANFGSLLLKSGERIAGMPDLLRPGQFNHFVLNCVDKHVTVKLNGQTVVDGEYDITTQGGLIGFQLTETETATGHELRVKDIKFEDLGNPPQPPR
jgi:serine/threonine protein kinase